VNELILPNWTLPVPTTAGPAETHCVPEKTFLVDDEELRSLVQAARRARALAYAPFSRFHVGCALTMADDPAQKVLTAANVENSSYGLTMCAERVALHHAAAAGFRQVRYLAVSCPSTQPSALAERSPCGACRQVIKEFADAATLILIDRGTPDLSADVFDIERLLLFGFRFVAPPMSA